LRRGGGLPKNSAFARGFGESDGDGAAGEFILHHLYGRGAANETVVTVECQHMGVRYAQARSAGRRQREGALRGCPGGHPFGNGLGGVRKGVLHAEIGILDVEPADQG
jgi:hypothetical protein